MALNLFACVGRLVADPELKHTPNNVAYLQITLAVERNSKTNGQKTDFIKMVAWRNVAVGLSKFAKKGMMFMVEGDVQSKSNLIGDKKVNMLSISIRTATVIGGMKVEEIDDYSFPEEDDDSDIG